MGCHVATARYPSVDAINTALILKACLPPSPPAPVPGSRSPDKRPYPSESSPLLSELAKYLDAAGMGAPLERIYITSDPLPALEWVAFLFVLSVLPKLTLDPALGLPPRDARLPPPPGRA